MSNCSLIIGPSGTGKSSALRNLDPKSTFVISILDKPLPFRGYKKKYTKIKGWDDTENNHFSSDDWTRIIMCIKMVNEKRPDIKVLILDDMQYLMANEFLRRATETGFTKFTELAQHIWMVINALINTRADLYTFALSHSELDQNGKYKCKTVGKLLDEKITLEGMFSLVFYSMVVDGEFKFLTQNDSVHTAKTPLAMFADKLIDNDLKSIIETMQDYFNDGDEE